MRIWPPEELTPPDVVILILTFLLFVTFLMAIVGDLSS